METAKKHSFWVYDLETYCNLFSATFKNIETKEIKVFAVHENRNDIDELYYFIQDTKKWLIGYNSFNFDNQILNYIYKKHFDLSLASNKVVTNNIYQLARVLIDSDFNDYRYQLPFRFLDLMKIGFYRKSLKLIGVSLKWPKLQDLPIPWDQPIKKEEIDVVLEYNINDVLITERLFYHLKDSIKLRFDLAKRYNVNVYSESDSGIANRLLEKFYSETSGLPLKAFKDLRTPRKFVKFDWVVFKDIHFNTNTLDTLLEEVKNHTYYEDKPFFKRAFTFDGVRYKMGVGGLHSEDEGALFEETDEIEIIDADIGSMYPASVINNGLTPAHLGNKFLRNFTALRDDRILAKKRGDVTPAEGLKIVLNSSVGKTLNKNHWLYDPLVNLQVTINGQLYLLMLIEQLALHGLHAISANTDGVTILVPKDKKELYYEICKDWEHRTRYDLEYTYYKKYARRDVNNYIAIKTNGEIKTKGIFVNEYPKRFSNMTDPLNKGWDKPIISKSLFEFFVNDKPIRETIQNETDIYNFCIAKKISDDFNNEFHSLENNELSITKIQKSVRYYVSTDGGVLLKEKEDGTKINYESGKKVTIFNDYVEKDIKNYNIDYSYYIHQTQKVINEIINPQLSLF